MEKDKTTYSRSNSKSCKTNSKLEAKNVELRKQERKEVEMENLQQRKL